MADWRVEVAAGRDVLVSWLERNARWARLGGELEHYQVLAIPPAYWGAWERYAPAKPVPLALHATHHRIEVALDLEHLRPMGEAIRFVVAPLGGDRSEVGVWALGGFEPYVEALLAEVRRTWPAPGDVGGTSEPADAGPALGRFKAAVAEMRAERDADAPTYSYDDIAAYMKMDRRQVRRLRMTLPPPLNAKSLRAAAFVQLVSRA